MDAPASAYQATATQIVRQLQRLHYQLPLIDDAFSERLLAHHLQRLDPDYRVWTVPQIEHLQQQYRHQLDDALHQGDMTLVFTLAQQWQQQWLQRLQHSLQRWQPPALTTGPLLPLPIHRAGHDAELEQRWQYWLEQQWRELEQPDRSQAQQYQHLQQQLDSQRLRLLQQSNDDIFAFFINSLTSLLDPHTQYLLPSAQTQFAIDLSLSLYGIGAQMVLKDGYATVQGIIANSPAQQDGRLQVQDRVVAVAPHGRDDEFIDVRYRSVADIAQLVRGPANTPVSLRVIRPNDTWHTIELLRAKITLDDQAAQGQIHQAHGHRLGVIHLPSFYFDAKRWRQGATDFNSASRDVARLLLQFSQQQVDAIVLDLRGNGGGSLQEAAQVSGLFIEQGPIVQLQMGNGRIQVLRDDDPQIHWSGPLAVLIDHRSASAAEIVAAAVQDYKRGLILGQTSFGKGTAQALHSLPLGTLKITQAKFYRVDGQSTQTKGVIPDITLLQAQDPLTYGEHRLPHALAWDSIDPLPYAPSSTQQLSLTYHPPAHLMRPISQDDDPHSLDRALAIVSDWLSTARKSNP